MVETILKAEFGPKCCFNVDEEGHFIAIVSHHLDLQTEGKVSLTHVLIQLNGYARR